MSNGEGVIASRNDLILVTGANGFIGSHVVRRLLARGFGRVRCLARMGRDGDNIRRLKSSEDGRQLEVLQGNLLSREACRHAVRGVAVIYHLAAGVEKTFPGCFLNSVVATRNLLDAALQEPTIHRVVNTSSLAVYDNSSIPWGGPLDETCRIDSRLVERWDPYAWAKAKQDELVLRYQREHSLAAVIVRPGVTFGPGKAKIPGRIGSDTFGVFLHLGLGRVMPLTYVENCADAIVLAGLTPAIEGEAINIVDDDLPTSRAFLRGYKRTVRSFVSIPVPYPVYYAFNVLWERYSTWSRGQLPPVFNRRTCSAYYKEHTYPNAKAKRLLGWRPLIPINEALRRFYAYAREMEPGRS